MDRVTDEDIGKRVVYKGRNGNARFGILKGFTGPTTAQFCNLKLEGSAREHFYVPIDTVTLVPVELGGIIADDDPA